MKELKTCAICHTTKRVREFNRDRSSKDGLDSRCKICNRERRKKYYWSHREQELKTDKKERENNPKHRLAIERNYKYGDKGKATTRHYWHIRQLRKGKKPILKIPCYRCESA